MVTGLRFAYVGNFGPEHSTENHLRRALEYLGHHVTLIQESGLDWSRVPNLALGHDYFMWTRTAGFDPGDLTTQRRALNFVGERMPTIGYHLDRWIGLPRESDIDRSPFFEVQFLFTADGGHPVFWQEKGINHWWMPPGVLGHEALLPGVYRRNLVADVGFVGNLRNYGHREWAPYRRALGEYLARHYGKRFRVWERGVRGNQLADVYATVKVLVGDSCLAGGGDELPGGVRGGATHYWSDRIPETLGRGGYLLHPFVEGLEEHHPALLTWPLGDFDWLKRQIDAALDDEPVRKLLIEVNRNHVLAHHTYERKMEQMLAVVDGSLR